VSNWTKESDGSFLMDLGSVRATVFEREGGWLWQIESEQPITPDSQSTVVGDHIVHDSTTAMRLAEKDAYMYYPEGFNAEGKKMRTEAEIIADLRRETNSERMMELDSELQHTRASVLDRSPELEIAATWAESAWTPVSVHERNTENTDFLAHVATLGDDEDFGPLARQAAAEATVWFNSTGPALRAHSDEFTEQCIGYAQTWASQYDAYAPHMRTAFYEQVSDLITRQGVQIGRVKIGEVTVEVEGDAKVEKEDGESDDEEKKDEESEDDSEKSKGDEEEKSDDDDEKKDEGEAKDEKSESKPPWLQKEEVKTALGDEGALALPDDNKDEEPEDMAQDTIWNNLLSLVSKHGALRVTATGYVVRDRQSQKLFEAGDQEEAENWIRHNDPEGKGGYHSVQTVANFHVGRTASGGYYVRDEDSNRMHEAPSRSEAEAWMAENTPKKRKYHVQESNAPFQGEGAGGSWNASLHTAAKCKMKNCENEAGDGGMCETHNKTFASWQGHEVMEREGKYWVTAHRPDLSRCAYGPLDSPEEAQSQMAFIRTAEENTSCATCNHMRNNHSAGGCDKCDCGQFRKQAADAGAPGTGDTKEEHDQSGQGVSSLDDVGVGDPNDKPAYGWEIGETSDGFVSGGNDDAKGAADVANVPTPGQSVADYPQPTKKTNPDINPWGQEASRRPFAHEVVRTAVTRGELSGQSGTFLTCPEHPYIEYSATPGDYFMMRDEDEFNCEECGGPLVEVRKSTTLHPVVKDIGHEGARKTAAWEDMKHRVVWFHEDGGPPVAQTNLADGSVWSRSRLKGIGREGVGTWKDGEPLEDMDSLVQGTLGLGGEGLDVEYLEGAGTMGTVDFRIEDAEGNDIYDDESYYGSLTRKRAYALLRILTTKTADHQGYKNYETFSIAVWIDNDRVLQGQVLDMARQHQGEDYEFASDLKEWVEEMVPEDSFGDGPWGSFVWASLGEVDWMELAEGWLNDAREITGSVADPRVLLGAVGEQIDAGSGSFLDAIAFAEEADGSGALARHAAGWLNNPFVEHHVEAEAQ
jgi:hypothetical protein